MAVSLRARVSAWIAAAVLLSGALVLGVVREGVRQALLHELDDNLHAEAEEILLEHAQLIATPERLYEIMELQARGHRDGAWYSQLLDEKGNVVFATTTTPVDVSHLPRSVSNRAENEGPYRILERASHETAGPGVIVRIGTSMPELHSDLDRIDRLVGYAGLSVLLAAPLTGFVLAGFALRPITEMTEQTDKMNPQRLDQRLPLRGTKDELDRLAAVINNLLGKISQYVGHHRGLMADAAHQLRTPLAAIRSSVEVVLTTEENSPDNRDLMGKVIEQIESLETLVNQLLLLAETEVDTLRPATECVSLDSIVKRSIDMFEAVADSCNVSLTVDQLVSCEIRGNRHHLRQVINNLLDNAIKFTSIKRGENPKCVTVSLKHDHNDSMAILVISDTGIGIGVKHVPHVFGRFYREGSLERSESGIRGNGLGLSIVKSVVESHGGEVSVNSVPGAGATFTITLPLWRDSTEGV